ncbi:MAG: ATP-binding cassette domain-containing protein [Oscillospiraceae bacterium]
MIELKNITKSYGEKLAVDNISFKIEKGEILGFLGPNGAGKSTTMNILTGYLSANDGTVVIDGVDMLENPKEAKKKIGYLPEQPPLYLDMSVQEYLDFLYDLKSCRLPRKAHIEEICDLAQVAHVKQRIIKNLSKGYRQRVGLAGALVGNPGVLVLDEPTVGLDPTQIIEIRELIKKLGENHTIILSSHILPEIEAVCERVIVIDKGRLIADDTPQNLSKQVSGDSSVYVRVGGDKSKAERALEKVGDVEKIEYSSKKEKNAHEFCITPKCGCDVRAQIVKTLCEESIPVLGLRFAELTLEDIFLELISKEA